MISADLEEGKNEGTGLTEKMGRLNLDDGSEEE